MNAKDLSTRRISLFRRTGNSGGFWRAALSPPLLAQACRPFQAVRWQREFDGREKMVCASCCGLTAAAVATLRRSRWLAQVLLWIPIELFFALGATEVIRLPSVLGSSSGGSRFYIHAAHKIFHDGCVFHYNVSSVRPVPEGTEHRLPVFLVQPSGQSLERPLETR